MEIEKLRDLALRLEANAELMRIKYETALEHLAPMALAYSLLSQEIPSTCRIEVCKDEPVNGVFDVWLGTVFSLVGKPMSFPLLDRSKFPVGRFDNGSYPRTLWDRFIGPDGLLRMNLVYEFAESQGIDMGDWRSEWARN